jgi:uncharacterized protein
LSRKLPGQDLQSAKPAAPQIRRNGFPTLCKAARRIRRYFNMRRSFWLTTSIFVLMAAPAMAQDTTPASQKPGTITMVGEGKVSAAPDMAEVTSGVVTQDKTARAALDDNTAAMSKLITVLKGTGIAEKDIQTSGFSVQPQYARANPDASGYVPPARIVGYRVTNNVTIRLRDLSRLGGVLDQAVTVGANAISGISFSIADPKTLLNEARQQAMADAMAKARLYADAANVGLGRVLSISEQGGPSPQPEAFKVMRAVSADSAVPVQSGEISYNVSVNVEWEIRQ